MKLNQEYIIYCGLEEDNNVVNIVSFKGNKKEVIEFMNKNYQRNEITCYFQNQTRFCFNADINDINNWKTLDQLIKEDIVEIKGE